MISDFISKYGISFWNAAILLWILNYWSETNLEMNFRNYLMFVALDLGRMFLSNPAYQMLIGSWGGSSSSSY